MLHDVRAVVGVFAWLGKPIDGIFLAAALTIVGLSVNDTVVVFDRVRELRRARPGEPFGRVVNAAVLQTVPRTINTGLGAMFILGALTVLGGDSLQDFALALLIGLVVGTTSSVFIASPLAVVLERRWPADRPPAVRADPAGDPSARGRIPIRSSVSGSSVLRSSAAGPSSTASSSSSASGSKRDRWSEVDPYADVPTGRNDRKSDLRVKRDIDRRRGC
jgi:SecD/SecF fusion protein